MSDMSQGEGWWQASDDRWYEPERHPSYRPPPPPPVNTTAPLPGTFPQPSQFAMSPVPYSQPGFVVPIRNCFTCGAIVVATAAVCTQCGTMLGSPKDKSAAVLLAVFLPPWNWLYTYKRDAAKFWIGLSLMFLGALLALVFIGFFVIFGVWLWAVIDAASKPEAYYRQFPNGPQ
jgi:hypothetical protein